MRGKRTPNRPPTWRTGLIPARAGKTRGRSGTRCTRRAHPRACGENQVGGGHQSDPIGSSPRVRGKRGRSVHRFPLVGLIPARAGKTGALAASVRGTGAHPRACGENEEVRQAREGQEGSSPRVRGKRRVGGGRHAGTGLIPARAGKTRGTPRRRPWPPAHPRACGENTTRVSPRPRPRGSSPRVRGKHVPGPARGVQFRLIPARAGKTART